MWRTLSILALAAVAAGLAGCQKRTLPPGDIGVCYHVAGQMPDGKLKYNRLKADVPNLESCAANLEAMRVKFLRMGGSTTEMVGAYQGNFIFLQREGIFTSPSLEQNRYLAMIRTGDGRLAIPGAVKIQ
jgi:hypothetical protein